MLHTGLLLQSFPWSQSGRSSGFSPVLEGWSRRDSAPELRPCLWWGSLQHGGSGLPLPLCLAGGAEAASVGTGMGSQMSPSSWLLGAHVGDTLCLGSHQAPQLA